MNVPLPIVKIVIFECEKEFPVVKTTEKFKFHKKTNEFLINEEIEECLKICKTLAEAIEFALTFKYSIFIDRD